MAEFRERRMQTSAPVPWWMWAAGLAVAITHLVLARPVPVGTDSARLAGIMLSLGWGAAIAWFGWQGFSTPRRLAVRGEVATVDREPVDPTSDHRLRYLRGRAMLHSAPGSGARLVVWREDGLDRATAVVAHHTAPLRLRPWFGVAALLCLAASPIPYLGLPAVVSILATTGLSAMFMLLNAVLGSEALAVLERDIHVRGATIAIDDGPPIQLADCYVVDEGQDVLLGLTQAGEEVEILRGPDAGRLCDGLHERLVLDEGEIDPKLTALRQVGTRETS